MKILVPLNNANYIDALIDAGTDEFYIGFYDERWDMAFGDQAEINRMSSMKKMANPYNFEEMLEIVSNIKSKGKSVFITINAPKYDTKQLAFLKLYFEKLHDAEVDGIIVSSPDVVLVAKSCGLKVVASTMTAVYNEDILSFYEHLGADKVIFPRDLSIQEIADLAKKSPHIQHEVFLMRNGCVFSDSNCLCSHASPYHSLCGMMRRVPLRLKCDRSDFPSQAEHSQNSQLYLKSYRSFACGICAIYDFLQMGIHSAKIVGRGDDPSYLIKDVVLAKKNIEIASSCHSRAEYLEKMVFPNGKYDMCIFGYSCYYPEIRFGGE